MKVAMLVHTPSIWYVSNIQIIFFKINVKLGKRFEIFHDLKLSTI
jgi:hypothetical protein